VFVYQDFHTGFFSLLRALGQVVFHLPPPLTGFYFSSLFLFQFCKTVQFWILLSGSEDELGDPLPALLQGVTYQPPALSLHCLSSVCLLIVGS
jgi:hypothetical protein